MKEAIGNETQYFFFYFDNIIYGIVKWLKSEDISVSRQKTANIKKYQNQNFFDHCYFGGG